jgi:serine acetyltransferase
MNLQSTAEKSSGTSGISELEKKWDIVSTAIKRSIETAETKTYSWTPNEQNLQIAVPFFLTDLEPTWMDSVIRRDPALYKHLGLADDNENLKKFLGTYEKNTPPTSLNTLKEAEKIDEETITAITNEAKTYQGLHAVAFHRIAHKFYEHYVEKKGQAAALIAEGKGKADPEVQAFRTSAAADLLTARKISQGVRRLTAGIEIHPGATIGKNFFIDHGAGVVIGETASVGNDCYFYHNVTLGATSRQGNPLTNASGARHPQIGSHVTLSNGVQILGPTVVGDHVKVAPLAELNGCREIGEGTKILDGAKLIGNITLGKKVRIGAGALVVGDVTIGEGAIIDPGVKVTRNIPAHAHVVGEVPNLPGILAPKDVGTPLMFDITPQAANDAKTQENPKPVVYTQGLELAGQAYRDASNDSWRDKVQPSSPLVVNAR